jgi:thiol-disulfide isomerase/thioredoxin
MKKNTLIYSSILLLLIFIVPFVSFANHYKIKENDAIISGKSDSAIKVELRFYPDFLIAQNKYYSIKSHDLNDQNFSFRLQNLKGPTYISVVFYYAKAHPVALELYLAEAGDSVYINNENRSFIFSGKSGVKFACQYQINQIKQSGVISIAKVNDLYEHSKQEEVMLDSLYKKKILILNSFQTAFSKKAYSLLQADFYFEKLLLYFTWAQSYFRNIRDSAKITQVIQYYKNYHLKQKRDSINADKAFYSRYYIDYLLSKIRLECLLHIKQSIAMPLTVPKLANSIYLEINTQYSGILKQRLLTTFFANQFIIDDSLGVQINRTVNQISHPYLHDIIVQIQRKTKGVKAYDFSLPDTSGRMVRLSDFKGKVVVLDFWYTGCPACPVMAEAIKPLANRKDSGVVFITISLDKNKQQWIESIKGSKYTSEGEINLYTSGMGKDHPIIQYNQISSFPHVIVINTHAKISTINPAAASYEKSKTLKLKEAIENAFKEN